MRGNCLELGGRQLLGHVLRAMYLYERQTSSLGCYLGEQNPESRGISGLKVRCAKSEIRDGRWMLPDGSMSAHILTRQIRQIR